MHVNLIAKRTIAVDGDLDDWQGTIPQTSAQTVGVSQTEKAYLPFLNWDRQGGGGAVTAWLAHDDKFFYFAAKVPQMDGLIRRVDEYAKRVEVDFETRKGHQLSFAFAAAMSRR